MVRDASWEPKFRMSGFHGLGETYPALSAAGARSHKYFWLDVWVEAESVMELLESKERVLKHSGRIGQNTGHGELSGSKVPSNVPTLTSCHRRCISNSAKGQGIQWAEAGRGNRPQGHKSTVFSTALRSMLWRQIRKQASEKDIGLEGGGFPLGIFSGFKCRAGRLLLQLNWRHTQTHASSVSSSSIGYRQL